MTINQINPMLIKLIANEAAKGIINPDQFEARITELFILYKVPIMLTDDELRPLMDMILPEYLAAKRKLKR